MNSSSNEPTCKKIQNYIFKFSDLLGQGNFSKVYKAFNQVTHQTVAIKIVQLNSLKSKKLQQLLFSQIQVLKKLNHPNILRCYEVFTSNRNCYIITELCNEGDLQSKLRKNNYFTEDKAISVIRDIYLGLQYLCQKSVIHRDLKVANIFMHNGKAKIADFGFAKFTKTKFKDINIGSPIYMSPQGLIQNVYGPKTDVWAFGIMIYQVLHGQTPFSHCKTQSELKYCMSIPIGWSQLKSQLSSDIKQVMLKCLQVKQQKRSTILQLKSLKFFANILQGQQNQQNGSWISKSINNLIKKSQSNQKNGSYNDKGNNGNSSSANKKSLEFNWKDLDPFSNNKSNITKNDFNYNDTGHKNNNKSSSNGRYRDESQPKMHLQPRINTNSKQKQINNFSGILQSGDKNKQSLYQNSISNVHQPVKNYRLSLQNNIRSYEGRNQQSAQRKGRPVDKIISISITFKACVNILHYCRLIYKYLTFVQVLNEKNSNNKLDFLNQQNQKNVFTRWLGIMVKTINTRIDNGSVIYQGDNAKLRQQKLKQVSKQYQKKYSKQLNVKFDKINPQESSIANYDYMSNYLYTIYQQIDSILIDNQNRQNKNLLIVGHYIIMILESTKVLKQCYESKNYKGFQTYKDVETLLNMKKEQMELPSYLWYKKKFITGGNNKK